jgi:hypothetical protein
LLLPRPQLPPSPRWDRADPNAGKTKQQLLDMMFGDSDEESDDNVILPKFEYSVQPNSICFSKFEPDHYYMSCGLDTIIDAIKTCLPKFNADFIYHPDQLSFHCTSYHYQGEVRFRVNIYFDYNLTCRVVEIKFIIGDNSGFLNAVRYLRYYFKWLGLIAGGDSSIPLRPFDQVKLSSAMLDAEGVVVHAGTEDTLVRDILQMIQSSFPVDGSRMLADVISEDVIKSVIAKNLDDFTSLMILRLRGSSPSVSRTIAASLYQMLSSSFGKGLDAIFLEKGGVAVINALILESSDELSTTHQVLRECVEVLKCLPDGSILQDAKSKVERCLGHQVSLVPAASA